MPTMPPQRRAGARTTAAAALPLAGSALLGSPALAAPTPVPGDNGDVKIHIDGGRTYEKEHFHNAEVYGARGRPELRLITCGGAYDRRTACAGDTVVFAHLTRTR
ncbi:hypothetical protein ABT065_27955 [Streptomyces sp. NPDC002764]|uniref:hypothetical protein n=1 Tax=Streptomyces sp. NPDC002764 TaxID=3154428 RepID=UPI00331E8595